MYEPVNGRFCRHWFFEDRVPLGENKVTGNDDAARFVALGQQHKQSVSLFPGMRDVGDVVNDQGFVSVQALDELVQRQVSFADQKILHERGCRAVEHAPEYSISLQICQKCLLSSSEIGKSRDEENEHDKCRG